MDRTSTELTIDAIDHAMMERCIALAMRAMDHGEYPYAAVISRNGEVVCESINSARHDHDVSHHAEVVAMSGVLSSPQPSEFRRLHHLCKCGALRVVLLRDARNTHRPCRVWRAGTAHWWSHTLELSYRYKAVRYRA